MESSTGCDACAKPPFTDSPLLPNSSQISGLRDILRSNTVPPEKSSFLTVSDGVSTELERYDAEIGRLQQRLAVLISDRTKLASYGDGWRSVFSPLRRLPPELLAEIFGMCYPHGEDVISERVSPTDEVDRVAKRYLLQLSQVCSHWHGIVMGTPRLWSTILLDAGLWNSCTVSSTTLLDLITASLDRGVDYPLTMRVAVDRGDANECFIFDLLSRHSHRWKCVYLWIDTRSLPLLVSVRGHLPLLASLELYNLGLVEDVPYADNIFEVAPNLTDVALRNWHPQLPTLPWQQLRLFTYGSTAFPDLNRAQTSPSLGTVIGYVTCPHLNSLSFRPDSGPPFRWNQLCFLEFASRSSLHATLIVLRIDAVIEEHELLQCLAALPLLEDIYLSDSEKHPPLITDNLLQQLIWRPDQPSLVPRLDFLCLKSLLRFNDDSLRDLITSRILPGRSDYVPSLEIRYLSDRERDLSPGLVEMMSTLEDSGDFSFEVVPAEDQ
ncbi:hypothetical protein DFH06DRAFT_1300831 [Mycena polygramma]|nr:hypothetical protein DFH06DRAFT_1300831 [Mycena polygramma]